MTRFVSWLASLRSARWSSVPSSTSVLSVLLASVDEDLVLRAVDAVETERTEVLEGVDIGSDIVLGLAATTVGVRGVGNSHLVTRRLGRRLLLLGLLLLRLLLGRLLLGRLLLGRLLLGCLFLGRLFRGLLSFGFLSIRVFVIRRRGGGWRRGGGGGGGGGGADSCGALVFFFLPLDLRFLGTWGLSAGTPAVTVTITGGAGLSGLMTFPS